MNMKKARYDRGLRNFTKIYGDLGLQVMENLNTISTDMSKYILEFAFGEIFERKDLDLKLREIVAISSLVTLGNATPQLKSHIHGALNIGCSRKQILEIIIQICLYSGFPSALNGLNVMKEVFDERDSKGIFP